MKPPAFLFCLLLLGIPFCANGQYSARQLTRKIVPQPDQQPARPNPPAQPSFPPGRPSATPPLESDRVRANREEAARKAVDFQKKRAEEGSGQAQYDLGVRYLKGDGVQRNDPLGREWLQKSANNGYIHAQRKLDELPKLNPPTAPPATSATAKAAINTLKPSPASEVQSNPNPAKSKN